jgi:hypothetical protein
MALMDQYASQEMVNDLRVLVSWKKDKGDDFAEEWRAAFDLGDATAKQIDGARRRVKQYFFKPLRLYENGHVGLPFLRTAAGMDGLNVLTEVVKPLEAVLNPPRKHPRASTSSPDFVETYIPLLWLFIPTRLTDDHNRMAPETVPHALGPKRKPIHPGAVLREDVLPRPAHDADHRPGP